MRIVIEFTYPDRALLTIDDHTLTVRRGEPGESSRIEGLSDNEREGTMGGLVAHALYMSIVDILRARESLRKHGAFGTWTPLSEDAIDAVMDTNIDF